MYRKESFENQSNCYDAASFLRLLPLIIFISISFLLVRVHEYTLPLSQFDYLSETDETVLFDCFSYIKAVTVVASAFLAFVTLAYYLITGRRRIRKTVLYIPMAVYVLSVIAAYICSDYRNFAFFGTFDRFEGTLVHVCYVFMMFYAINCIDSEGEVKLITDSLFVGVAIACLIGLTQFVGNDFFAGSIGKKLLLGSLDDEILFSFGRGRVYQTVYNINYVAFYMCLVVPILLNRIVDIAVDIRKSSWARKIYLAWLAVLLVLICINILGSDSAGSLPGILFGIAGTLILRFGKQYKKFALCILVGGYVIVFILAQTGLFGRNYSLIAEDIQDRPKIEYIEVHDNTIEFMIEGKVFVTKYDAETEEFMLYNGEGKSLDTFQIPDNEYRYEIDDNGDFSGRIAFTPITRDGRTYAVFDTKDQQWAFEYTDEGAKYINSAGNRVDISDDAKHAGIIKNYSFGSGRGYIWDTTLPIVARHPIIGSGADTFMMEFPQDDYLTKYSHGLSADCVYDKPHNMYLQIAVCFGLAGLAAFLAMIATALFVILKIRSNGKVDMLYISIVIGIIAFLISATVNDSSVQVMPMFYGLLGCACSKNQNFEIQKCHKWLTK